MRKVLAVCATAVAIGAVALPAGTAAAGQPATPGNGHAANKIYYGHCQYNARIHTRPTTHSTTLGICAGGHRIRSDGTVTGEYVNAGQCSGTYWYHLRDLRTNVVGYVHACGVRLD